MKKITPVLLTATALPWPVRAVINLFTDLCTYLMAISAVVAVALIMYNGIKWYSADTNEKPAEMKKIKTIVIGAIVVVLAEWLVSFVLGYFVAPV